MNIKMISLCMMFNSNRIDHFIGSYVHRKDKYRKPWKIIMFVFGLSHGQSVAEKGFSTDKEVKVENPKKVSPINQSVTGILTCHVMQKVTYTI